MLKSKTIIAVVGASLVCVPALAQNIAVIKERQKVYKSFGEATKPVALMLKGQADFDLKTVREALTKYSEGSKKLPDLFPDDAKQGADTEALPAIWEHKTDFNDRLKKFGADAEAALVTIKDQQTFAATFPSIAKECGGCHKQYREKKEKD